jgi:regulator of protease activity HflC (stomatin/prohibitin superfamily)
VLTPGTYRINPWVYKVEKHPAVVIPAGFVGVVTNQVGEAAPLRAGAGGGADEDAVRRLARAGERGTLRDVLQPGIYYINPYVQKVTLIEIGFNEYSEVRVGDQENLYISFPSDTGYDIRVGVTIIWGIDPKHAAQIINEFGNVDRVLETVIGSQLPSICRNIGSTYDARDFIHGEKRELFQRALTEELQEICRAKNVEVLLALVREIEVHAPKAGTDAADEVSEDLKRTIQQSYLAIENRITKEKQREAAIVRAELEEARKKVDIARETILADTRVMVAEILAEAEKEAAQIDAQAKLEVAQVQEQIAKLDAQRTEILGQARTDVDKLKKQAEADGYRLLVDAFGGGRAFNLYTFAENFQPESIRLFFAGDGTFWTDLDRFQDVGAAKILESGVAKD